MRGIADQGRSALGRDPGREGVPVDQLPVHEVFFWGGANNVPDGFVPAFADLQSIFDLAGRLPAFLDVGLILCREIVRRESVEH